MKHTRRSLFILLLVALCVAPGRFAVARRAGQVTWKATATPATARPGEVVAVTATANVAPGFHIYSIVPVPPPGPAETTLMVAAKGLTTEGGVREVAPHKIKDENFGKELGVHEGTPAFTQYIRVPKTATAGTSAPFTATVRFMVCNDSTCYPPKTVDLTVAPLQIEAGEARAEYANLPANATATGGPQTAAPGGGAIPPTSDNALPVSGTGQNAEGLLPFVATAFAAGLLALVTPCVFPMIPVTLAYFTKQATAKGADATAVRGGVVKLAAVYSLGIVLAFTVIGAVLAATVGAGAANQFAANPFVNIGFAVLFVVFALALLEVFELRLPDGVQRLSAKSRGAGGTLGVLGMGLTFVVAAFTCTAPFIGTVLVAASQASSGAQWVRPIVGMTAFSAALALPFFLLALFPSLLARMPKSGAWLSTVKGAMGFLELAAALKFLSNADMVFQWGLLTRPVVLGLWMLIAALGAAWLLGLLKIGISAPDAPAPVARRTWAGVFVLSALYCLWGLTGRPLQADMQALLPPPEYSAPGSAGASGVASDDLVYLDTLEAGLAQAKAENKPIFIDFTGYTCTNCRRMEQTIFPVPEVKAELSKFVRVRLHTDDLKRGTALQAYQEKTFGDISLPMYAILSPDGAPQTKPVGFTRDAAGFAAFLRTGREKVATTRPQIAKR